MQRPLSFSSNRPSRPPASAAAVTFATQPAPRRVEALRYASATHQAPPAAVMSTPPSVHSFSGSHTFLTSGSVGAPVAPSAAHGSNTATTRSGAAVSPISTWASRSADPSPVSRIEGGAATARQLSAPSNATAAATPASFLSRLSPSASSPKAAPSSSLPVAAAAAAAAVGSTVAPGARGSAQPQLHYTPLRSASTLPGNTASTLPGNTASASASASAFAATMPSPPPPVQLQVFQFAVKELTLPGATAGPLPLLLRGSLGGASLPFCTNSVWPTEEAGWAAQEGKQHGAANCVCAAWPEAVVCEALMLDEELQSAGATRDARQTRTVTLECYLSEAPSPPHSVQQQQQPVYETLVASCVLRLAEVVEAAAQDLGTASVVEVALRGEEGGVVGRLSFAVRLQAVACRTARVEAVAVSPHPLLAEDGYGGSAHGSGRQPRDVTFDGSLSLSLAAPQSELPLSQSGPVVPADFCTAASVRWTTLPSFTFYEAPMNTAEEGASAAAAAPLARPLPASPLLVGQLYYCPAQGSRAAARRSLVLLGTFALPPSPPTPASAGASVAVERFPFHVPLRTSVEGGQWMAMGDCWVRGVVETWAEPAELDAEAVRRWVAAARRAEEEREEEEEGRSALLLLPPPQPLLSPFSSARAAGGGVARHVSPPSRTAAAAPPHTSARVQPDHNTNTLELDTPTRHPQRPQPSSPPSLSQPLPQAPPSQHAPQEDAALQRVKERQEALTQRVQDRLAEVQEQRHRLRQEMAAEAARAAAEENAILEEFGLLENEQAEAEAAYREATARLVEMEEYHDERVAHHDAYLEEQQRALEEVARERAEATELKAQLEALQAQMAAHMAAEQARYTARAERARTAMEKVEANSRWLTEVEAKIAAAEAGH